MHNVCEIRGLDFIASVTFQESGGSSSVYKTVYDSYFFLISEQEI